MKKALCIILLCATVLTGCQGKKDEPVQSALDFRTMVMGAERCNFSAQIEADFEDRVYIFSVDCEFKPLDGTAALTITGPDTIAGITATVGEGDAHVEFSGTSVELGTMAGGYVAPMALPRLLGAAWMEGYIVSVAQGDDGWTATYQSGYGLEQVEILTHFTPQDTPRTAEIFYDDVRVLTATIDNFSIA